MCPEIAIFVKNCYVKPARLFVIGGIEIASSEGTTQGDPIAMAIYATAIIPLLLLVLEVTDQLPGKRTKSVALADDLTAGGSIENLKSWWNRLNIMGPKFGYHPNASKCWLIVKNPFESQARSVFSDTTVKITTDGKRHLGAVIGTEKYKFAYVSEKINIIYNELLILCEFAKTDPQSAYCCFVSGFRHKLTFMMRTIPNISHVLKPSDDLVLTKFIPTIVGVQVNDLQRLLLSLPVKEGGLALPIFSDLSDIEYENSRNVTEKHRQSIKDQKRQYSKDDDIRSKKSKVKQERRERIKTALSMLKNDMNKEQLRLLDLSQEIGTSSWLSTLPLKEEGFHLTKQAFVDLIRIRYGWQLQSFPSICECGTTNTIEHSLSCKKGGFVTLRHNDIRNTTAKLLSEVCNEVRIEPMLQPLSGENVGNSNDSDQARSDICARSFWVSGQMAFYDVRVFNPLAKRYRDLELTACYRSNEKEKKNHYNQRIMEVEHGSFTPLVFAATGGMGRECTKFYNRLSEMIAEKRNVCKSKISSYIRRKIKFSLLRSLIRCIRGSRSVYGSIQLNNNIVACEYRAAIN